MIIFQRQKLGEINQINARVFLEDLQGGFLFSTFRGGEGIPDIGDNLFSAITTITMRERGDALRNSHLLHNKRWRVVVNKGRKKWKERT